MINAVSVNIFNDFALPKFLNPNSEFLIRAISSAGPERLPYKQEAGSSNLPSPTAF